jgi:hypothetical protein
VSISSTPNLCSNVIIPVYVFLNFSIADETKEPLTSGWLSFKAWFMKIAPESQL